MTTPDGVGGIIGNLSSSPAFDAYAERWGGVAQRRPAIPASDGFDDELFIAIQAWREITGRPRHDRNGVPFVGHFGFLEDPTPNAFADYIDGVHFAGVHRGLLDIFDFLGIELYIRRRLVDVGGQEIEVDLDMPLDLLPSPERIAEQRADYPRYVSQANRANILAARYFRHLALVFALFHEFHHCIFGHCAYAQATLGMARLNEFGSDHLAAGTWELHKEVEFVADMGAIDLMFWYVDRGTLLSRLHAPALPVRTQHRLTLLVLSVVCALCLRLDEGDSSPSQHPDPAQRALVLMHLYVGRLRERYRWSFWKPLRILRHAAIDSGILSVYSEELTAVRARMLEINNPAWMEGEMADLFDLTNKAIRAYEYAEAPRLGGRRRGP